MSDTASYNNDQQRDAQAAMAEAFQSEGVQNSLRIDIDNFTKTVKTITENFEYVERKLGEIDALGLDGANKYQPTWTGYKRRYRDLLWDSRDLATKIATQAEQFGTVYLPVVTSKDDPSLTNQVKAESLKQFIDANEVHGKEADTMNRKFSDLAEDVTTFKNSFSSFAAAQLKEANKNIQSLESELVGLNSELESINRKIIGLTVGLGLVIFATVALCIVFPAATAQIATAGVAAATGTVAAIGVAYDQRSTTVSKIATKTKEVENLKNTVKEIEQARTELKSLADNQVSQIIGGLTMLSDIWRNVKSDTQSIETYLRNAAQSSADWEKDPNAPVCLKSYLKNGVSIYLGLRDALKLYAQGVLNAQQN